MPIWPFLTIPAARLLARRCVSAGRGRGASAGPDMRRDLRLWAVLANFAGMKPLVKISVCLAAALAPAGARPCTSAIISGSLTPTGKPILWKNRDTSAADNKVEYVAPGAPGELAYVGLFNSSDTRCEQAWIGVNQAGFAVMNTASYNLKADNVPASEMDREGYVMALALKHCRTVDDFATLLRELPRPLGVEANFGVIDASGAGAYFECDNYRFTRYDLSDSGCGVMVRTNYSHSGRAGEGYGQIRERDAWHLLAPHIEAGLVEPYTLTDGLSCSYYHDLYGRDMAACGQRYLVDQDFIPRFTTTATVAIEDGVMWTAVGYPPVAELMPVWCAPDGVHPDLRGTMPGGVCPAGDRARRRKAEVFGLADGNRDRYVDLEALAGPRGCMRVLREQNRQTYDRFHRQTTP